MAQMKFTEAKVSAIATPKDGRVDYRDDDYPGLQLRVGITGTKTWSSWFRIKGADKAQRETIGRWPTISVQVAIAKNKSMGGLVADRKDPGELRKREANEKTLGEGFDLYMADAKQRGVRRLDDMRQTWERYVGAMPEQLERKRHARMRTKAATGVDWSARKLSAPTLDDLKGLHKRILLGGHATMANRVVELVSAMYGFLIAEKLYFGANPAGEDFPYAPEISRKRFLKSQEMKPFFDALAATPQPWQDLFTLGLYVGYRRGAIQAMRWQDIDMENALWEVPGTKSKNGEATIIPLTPQAMEVLRRRWEESKDGAVYVFPGDNAQGHVGRPKKAWAQLIARAKLKDHLTPHDLRRSLGSWMAMSGTSLPMIGQALGHKDAKSTAVYARLQTEMVNGAMDRATAKMLAMLKGAAPKKARLQLVKRKAA